MTTDRGAHPVPGAGIPVSGGGVCRSVPRMTTDTPDHGAHPRFAEAKVGRADARVVRETTGYAIGGVPPFGHRTRTRVLADRALLEHDLVWAAAGTPYTVFPVAPEDLVVHAGATVADVRERTA